MIFNRSLQTCGTAHPYMPHRAGGCPMYTVDTKPTPIADLSSFVRRTLAADVEEIKTGWSREVALLGYPCPKLPKETAENVFSTLREFGQDRLTFFVPGHPEAPCC